MRALRFLIVVVSLVSVMWSAASAEQSWIVYDGFDGPGKGKHIVLVSGDEEYRSEEALPQLGKILAVHHGFKCTVLFAVNPETGEIDPNNRSNIPGLEALEDADLMIVALRFRDLPNEQMKHIVDYVEAGKPVMGLRTSTHAFNIGKGKKYSKYHFRNGDEDYKDGFGRQVLGETWISHHGRHGSQATRGIIAPGAESHPILRGIKDGHIFGPTDVYGVRLPLPGDSKPLVLGQVVDGMTAESPAAEGKKNDPMMPVAWTKTYTGDSGKAGRVFTTTMGASEDLLAEGTRRLLVNGTYWCVGMENEIPDKSKAEIVGEFKPNRFRFGGFTKGVKPADYKL